MTHDNQRFDTSRPDGEALVRAIARAVIRRVQLENPGCSGKELRVLVDAANPFGGADEIIRKVWDEEAAWAVQAYSPNIQ